MAYFAPNAKRRSKVVAYRSVTQLTEATLAATRAETRADDDMDHGKQEEPQTTVERARPTTTWTEFMRRKFDIEVLACQHHGGAAG